jgi:hypothetical protein
MEHENTMMTLGNNLVRQSKSSADAGEMYLFPDLNTILGHSTRSISPQSSHATSFQVNLVVLLCVVAVEYVFEILVHGGRLNTSAPGS